MTVGEKTGGAVGAQEGPASANSKRVLFVAPSRMVQDWFAAFSRGAAPDLVVDSRSSLAEARDALTADTAPPYDLIFARLRPEDHQALAALREIAAADHGIAVVVIADVGANGQARDLLQAGIRGIMPPSTSGLVAVNVLRLVLAGGVYVAPEVALDLGGDTARSTGSRGGAGSPADEARLTRRQRQVLALIGSGLSNRAIAVEIGARESTVKAHVNAIMRKLGVSNRTQAALHAARLAIIDKPANRRRP